MTILRTSSSLATAAQVAAIMKDPSVRRYEGIPADERLRWIGSQIYALCAMTHQKRPDPSDVMMDAAFFDNAVMQDWGYRTMTLPEMQDAFRQGALGNFGEFFGMTSGSLVMFLDGFLKSDKRREARAIIKAEQDRKLKEKEEAFWKKIHEAQKDGKIHLPDLDNAFRAD